jgi:hypothetical protein
LNKELIKANSPQTPYTDADKLKKERAKNSKLVDQIKDLESTEND